MGDDFDQAEIYIKEVLAMPIEIAIKDINKELITDRIVPGVKLVVTGGQAIQTYFPNSPELRTHDYDLKLIAPDNIPYTPRIKRRMLLLGKAIVRYIANKLNDYAKQTNLIQTVRNKYNLTLRSNLSNGNIFNSSSRLRLAYLNTVKFRLSNPTKIRTNAIVDVYVVNPREIYHYETFIGGNKILSEGSGNYYIPHENINGIPYAGMGYILWDTLRMIDYAYKHKLAKYQRYVDKKDAMLNALNQPKDKLSCNSMKGFVLNCEDKYYDCTIRGTRYRTVNSLLRFAITEGLIPPDRSIVNKIRETYDLNYLCSVVKKVL